MPRDPRPPGSKQGGLPTRGLLMCVSRTHATALGCFYEGILADSKIVSFERERERESWELDCFLWVFPG